MWKRYANKLGAAAAAAAVGGTAWYLSGRKPTPTPTPTPTATPTPTPTPFKRGRTLHVGIRGDIATVDAHFAVGFSTRVVTNLYDPFYCFDVNGKWPNPVLASEAPEKVTLKEWIVPLREGIKFHCGETFDAHMAREAIMYDLDPTHPCTEIGMFPPIDKVVAVDDYTLKFLLRRPHGFFPEDMQRYYVNVTCPVCREEYGEDFGSKVACGTGAFMFNELEGIGEWERGKYLKLARSPDANVMIAQRNRPWPEGTYMYGPANLDYLQYDIIPEDATIAMALHKGEIDLHPKSPIGYIADLAADPELDMKVKSVDRHLMFDINSAKFPTDIRDFRFAIYYAIDTVKIINTILVNAGVPHESCVGSAAFGWVPMGFNEYDPDKSRELLDKINWDEIGKDIDHTITLLYSVVRDPLNPEVCEAVASYIEAVGIKVNLLGLEHATYMAEMEAKPYDERKNHMVLVGWETTAPSLFAYRFHKESRNYSGITNPELDKVIEDMAVAEAPEEIKRLIGRASEIILTEECYALPFYESTWGFCQSRKVHDFDPFWEYFQVRKYVDVWKEP